MLYSKTIRQIIASIMLVVFAFSITPQKNIHDAVAKHIDRTICKVHLNLPIDQVENSSIHCSFDQLVVTAPFVDYNFSVQLITPSIVAVKNAVAITYLASSLITQFDSRGPPVI